MCRCSLIVALAALLPTVSPMAETYTNKEYGFAIDFPAGWEVKGSASSNTIIKGVHKNGQGRLALIAVAAYPMDAEGDIWDVSGEQMFEGFKRENPGAEAALLDSGKTVVGGEHAIWTLIDVPSPAVISMLTRSYHFVRKPFLFRISASTDRDRAWFTQHERTFQESIASFRFLNAEGQARSAMNSELGESLWVALFKSYGIYLIVLAAVIVLGVIKGTWGRANRRGSTDEETQ